MNSSYLKNEANVPTQNLKSPKVLREPHKNKKWQPSSLELSVLKFYFQKDHSPTKERQHFLLKKLHENFGSHISLEQLQDWIEEEIISKASKYRKKDHPNRSYVKLPQTDLDILEKFFEKDNYPSYEEMQKTADAFGVSLSKIENWYKHQRRSLAKKGELIIKTKRRFDPKERDFLMTLFAQNAKPSPHQIQMIASQLSCTDLQVKNWYSNRRKKLRRLSKKQSSSVHSSLINISTSSPVFDETNAYLSFKDHATLAQTQAKESNRREDSLNVKTTLQDAPTSEINSIGLQGSRSQVTNAQVQANFSNIFIPTASSCFLRPNNLDLLPINFNANLTQITSPLDQNLRHGFAPKSMNFELINTPPLASWVYQNPSNQKYPSFNHNNC